MVVHVCNPSYLGDRGRRILGLRPALAKVAARSYFKNKIQAKMGLEHG
jgi:hypothetical protein